MADTKFTLTTFEMTLKGINHVAEKIGYTSISKEFPITKAVEAYDYIAEVYNRLIDFAVSVQEYHPEEISDELVERMSEGIGEVLNKLNCMEVTYNAIKTLENDFAEFIEICSKF